MSMHQRKQRLLVQNGGRMAGWRFVAGVTEYRTHTITSAAGLSEGPTGMLIRRMGHSNPGRSRTETVAYSTF